MPVKSRLKITQAVFSRKIKMPNNLGQTCVQHARALKSCPNFHKLPNLVTLNLICRPSSVAPAFSLLYVPHTSRITLPIVPL